MKDVVVYVATCHGYSERRVCALTRQARSTQYERWSHTRWRTRHDRIREQPR
jgi:hypothetical protein